MSTTLVLMAQTKDQIVHLMIVFSNRLGLAHPLSQNLENGSIFSSLAQVFPLMLIGLHEKLRLKDVVPTVIGLEPF